MIDQAGIMMAQGYSIASERIAGVNDNMAKSHYHDYFELYYLEAGERYHMIQDRLYKIYPGEFLIFPPYMMHHSYGEKNVEFKRLLLYFRKEEVSSPSLLHILEEGTGVYKPDMRTKHLIHRMLEGLLSEQEKQGSLSELYSHTLLNMILLIIVRQIQTPVKEEKKGRVSTCDTLNTRKKSTVHLSRPETSGTGFQPRRAGGLRHERRFQLYPISRDIRPKEAQFPVPGGPAQGHGVPSSAEIFQCGVKSLRDHPPGQTL